MNPEKLINTIYLGDRFCKAFVIDGWNSEIRVQVDCISRVRGMNWNFYQKEDLVDGWLVFTGVREFTLDPAGPLPNDSINDFQIEESRVSVGATGFALFVSSCDSSGTSTEIKVRISATGFCIETNDDKRTRIYD